MKFECVNLRGKFLLLILIELKGSEWVEFLAYLDSGARNLPETRRVSVYDRPHL